MRDRPDSRDNDPLRIAIAEERLAVSRETVETGRVRVETRVVPETVPIEETLAHVAVRVERFPVDRLVDDAPPVRTEGDRTIVSVTEEVLVKRIRIVEEIHLVAERTQDQVREKVRLHRTEVDVTRT